MSLGKQPLSQHSQPPPERLIQAVAQTLGISRDDILLYDSFRELGGDENKAEALRLACRRRGIDVKSEDVLSCPTLAELQTRITAFPEPLPLDSTNSTTSGSEDSIRSPGAEEEDDDVFSPKSRKWADSMSSYDSVSTDDDSVKPIRSSLESLLRSYPRVRNVCLATPKAGPFDGQLVAFLSITSSSGSTESEVDDIALPPRREMELQRREMRSLRMAVQEWAADDARRPQIWIPIANMPVSENHEPDARRLQMWAQEMSNSTYDEVMRIQVAEPRRRRDISPGSWRKKVQSWAESRKSMLAPRDVEELGETVCFPLSPMQQLYFQAMGRKGEAIAEPECRYTQSVMLRVRGGTKASHVEAAVEALVARHEMLRARFRPVLQDWVQVVVPQASSSYRFTRHTDVNDEELRGLVKEAQVAINPTKGPVFAVEHIQNENEQILHLTAHHLIVDPLSWRIMIHDLDKLLQRTALPPKPSTTFPRWIEYQNYEMSQRLFEPTLPFDVLSADLEYWDLTQKANTFGNTHRSSFYLTPELVYILQNASADVLRTEPVDVLLAALLLSFSHMFPDRPLPTLWKQEHGRGAVDGDLNIMDTAGWFASLCPIGVLLDSTIDLIQAIKLIKDTRRTVPREGVPYFAAEFSTSKGAAASLPVEVMFNCVDTAEQLQRKNGILESVPAPDQKAASLRSEACPEVGRIALFEVSVMMDGSGAQVDFEYNKTAKHQDKIETWVQVFERLVLEAAGKLQHHEPELTLSDAPLLRSSYKALAKLTSERLAGAPIPNIRDIETIYPVTPAQQEILIAQTQNIDTFHVHTVYELRTRSKRAIDTARLCKAWEAIVANKHALRSIFVDGVSREGLFDQVILKKTSPSMLFIESIDPDEAVSTLPELNMSLTEPRHRLSVCHNPDRTLVRLDASQAICDLASLDLLVAELSRVYSGEEPVHNEALHRTYLYHVSSTDMAYSMEVWKIGLSRSRPCLFPHLSPSTGETFQSQPYSLDVTKPQLQAFCAQQQVEPQAIVQLAWALVLRTFVGTDHITFGYQFGGRDEQLLSGINQAVGSFATLLPCCVELGPHQSTRDCLESVGESFINSRKHDNVTMAKIQHALRLKEKLFNTCLYFEDPDPFDNSQFENRKFADLIASPMTSGRRTDCDLSLTAIFANGRLQVSFTSRHLSHNQTQSIISSFEAALKRILEHPDSSVAEADLFTDRHYAQLVVNDWESTQRSRKISACVHDVILQHSLTRPDATAVCSWDGDMSYALLATLVARLRTYLVNLGIGPGMAVPVVLDKNHWAPVMLLAVMQAGASFVALDCNDPVTAKSTIDHLRPHIVLAAETAWRDLSAMVLNLVIVNDSLFANLPPHMSSLAREASPEQAACVFISPRASRSIFFTHSSLCSIFVSQGQALKIDSLSRVLQLSAFNVDISLVEILGTMLHGGCVCIPSAKVRAQDLTGAMARMGVTWSYMTGILARRIAPSSVPSLQTLCFRTRKLDPDTYGPWLESRNVLLAYGAPDICPLGISITEVERDQPLNVITPPVTGRFWVLNPEDPRKLMPIGAIGELAIDSPLVTPHRFALGRPLVAPSVQHQEGEKPKSRYLKTGHRVRYLDSGNIEFLSSVRDDIVVDGSIIDVTEIEQQIRRCLGKGIDVVVDSIKTRDSPPFLAAFLELDPTLFHGQASFCEVSERVKERAHLAKKMFDESVENPGPHTPRISRHCVPSIFIPVKELPVSTSLKVNRRKLQRIVSQLLYRDLAAMSTVPNPAEIQRLVLAQKPLPLTRPEQVMRSIWAGVLRIPPADIKGSNSFFSAGGNKLLATEVVIACRKYGLHVSLLDILNEASLTDMCRAAESSNKPTKKTQDMSAHSHLAVSMVKFDKALVKDVIAPQLHCSPRDVLDVTEASSQQIRNLELGMFSSRADIVCLVIKFNGPLNLSKLETACEDLATMHPALKTAFVSHEHQVYQVHLASPAPFRTYHCEFKLDKMTETIVSEDQSLAFDPKTPVTQFTFLDSNKQGTLIMRLSKTQIDSTSSHLIVQDLICLYEGDASTTPRSSFLEYTRASRINREQGLEFWKCQLENITMTNVINDTKPTPPTALTEIKSLQHTTTQGRLVDYGMAPDTALKAAWAIVLATLSGANDVLFGEVIHTQNVPPPFAMDLGSMVGPLTNVIPVRVQFPAIHSTPLDLMACVQSQRQSNARFDMFGFQELVNECTNWRSSTQFSTVVQHDVKPPLDGSSTLNIDGMTFTYQTIEPPAQDFPHLFVRSTVEGADRVTLEIKYSEDRLSTSFVQSCLSLLVAAWETLTHADTIHQPMVQSAEEISRSVKKIPFPPKESSTLHVPLDVVLQPAQRKDLRTAIAGAWYEAIKPSYNIPQRQLETIPFYAISRSILPAHSLTTYLNQAIKPLNIPNLDTITLKVEDILSNPTSESQLEHIAHLLRTAGTLALPVPPIPKSEASSTLRRPKSRSGPQSERSVSWRKSFLGLRGRSSMKDLSLKASEWIKSKKSTSDTSLPSASGVHELDGASRKNTVAELPAQPPSESSVPRLGSLYSESAKPIAELEGTVLSYDAVDPGSPVDRGSLVDRSSIGDSSWRSVEDVDSSRRSVEEVVEVSPVGPFHVDKHRSIWGAVLDLPRRTMSPRFLR
ncbi:hypothetical protein ACHAPT_009141 [Fusarium lateritium]